jgi:hypothetical protein
LRPIEAQSSCHDVSRDKKNQTFMQFAYFDGIAGDVTVMQRRSSTSLSSPWARPRWAHNNR